VNDENAPRSYSLAGGGNLLVYDGWLGPEEASALFAALRSEIAWRQERVRIAGREHLQPRLIAWFGDSGASYTYSGLTLAPDRWPTRLMPLRARLEEQTQTPFNSVLCNYYRDGNDSMGLHADDEPELGRNPVIASVSLGATRRFVLRHVKDKTARLDLDLAGGSLLVMGGTTQHFWRHGAPRQPRVTEGRINLTFRRILL